MNMQDKLKEKTNMILGDKKANATIRFRGKLKQNDKCIFIMGLNPAGYKNGNQNQYIDEEDPNFIYLYDILKDSKNIVKDDKYTNHTYFGIIWNVMEEVCGKGNIKWDWCNEKLDFNKDKEKYFKDFKDDDIDKIREFYNTYTKKDNQKEVYTILMGDLLAYHETNSEEIKKYIEEKKKENKSIYNDIIKDILNIYIDNIIKTGAKLKFIYINNAYASKEIVKAIRDDEKSKNNKEFRDSKIEYIYKGKKYTIILGGMLSGRNRMDSYSKYRLIEQMKNYI